MRRLAASGTGRYDAAGGGGADGGATCFRRYSPAPSARAAPRAASQRPSVEAVDADHPRRGARVDPAVQRLVAGAQLLPFQLVEAAPGLHRDQLLGDQLLDALGVEPLRQMHVAGRLGDAGSDLLVGRRDPGAGTDRARILNTATATVHSLAPPRERLPRPCRASTLVGPATGVVRSKPSTPLIAITCAALCRRVQA